MARKSKKHITYDSKETHTIIGLVSLLVGFFFIISLLSSNENQSSLFTQARNLFGQSTIFTAVFLISFGLHFLGSKLPFTNPKSLIAQFILIFLIPGFLTSFSSTPRELSRLTGEEVLGGEVGYFIVVTLLGDRFPTQPATKFLLLAGVLVATPIALSMSLSNLIDKISAGLSWVYNFFKNKSNESEIDKEFDIPEKASTFGDFNKLLKQNQKNIEDSKSQKISFEDKPEIVRHSKKRSDAAVEIKEGSIGDEGLKQEFLKFPDWQLPSLSLLVPYKKGLSKEPTITQNAKVIEQILQSFGIEARVEESFVGPSVIQYALNIPLGIKVEKISNLAANIALALGVDSKAVRIESIPETTYLGIEVPRSKRDVVRMKELMESDEMLFTQTVLPVPVGKNIDGTAIVADLRKMPHLLIAGATGSGKSVLTNSFITSLLMKKTPDELKFILVDPKQVELSDYNGIPHLLTPVITDMDHVVNALKWAVKEMELRYTNLKNEQVRDIASFNEKKGFAAMPYIVIVIDEMADMMMTANRVEAENAVVRLAQKARAVGIHLILATQRPSVNVITGIIKANIPGRIGMGVTSSTDSRVILDRIGAESLLGNGDLLYKAPDKPKSMRLQGAFIEQQEVIRIVDFIKSQAPEVEYSNEIVEKQVLPGEEADGFTFNGSQAQGSLIEQSIRIAVQYQKGSSSFLQRKLNIGFNKAAQLVEELEELGVVGPQNGSKPREVLVSDAEAFIAALKGQE
jgi:DNA segregation ATPase FtsK/SpoIIIE, S-DNA-T family